jgi:hypothetical protein
MIRNFLYATAMVAVWSVSAASVSAQFGDGNSPNNLFSQYYTQPGASAVQAGMYPAPHWVPSYVGHSYYTYQPLMPHEMMYQHSRNYYNYYNTGGYYGGADALNKTTVRWQSGSNHMGPLPFSGNLMQKIKWHHYSNRYCLNGDCSGLGSCGGHCSGLHGVGGRLHGALHGHCHHGQCHQGNCDPGTNCQEPECQDSYLSQNPDTNVQR